MIYKIKRIWLILASSFTLNFIALGIILFMILFNIGNIWVWKLLSAIFCINALFLNANYFRYIKHKVS